MQHGQIPLRLNLDETNIELNHDDAKGVVHNRATRKLVDFSQKEISKTWFCDACCARL